MTTRTGAEQQVRNTFIYLLPVFVGNAIPLVTLPIFTRLLSREEYGAWALATAYALFVTGIANFGLTIGYERNFFVHREQPQRGLLLYSTIAFVVVAFALTGALTWIFRAPLARWVIGSPAYASLLFWTLCANAAMSLKAYYLIYFRNTADARSHVWYTVDESVLAAVFGVILVAGFRIGVKGLVFGQLLASAGVVTALTIRFLRRLPPGFSLPLLRESLHISYPLTPRILFGVAGNQIDKYLLGLLGTIGGVGVYAVGQKFAYIVFTYMTALENVFAPQVYERMFTLGDAGGASVGRYLTPFAYLSIAAALGIGLFAEEAIHVLTPPSYHGAIPIAGILSLHYAVMFFGKLPQLVYAKKTGIISALTLVSLAANAVLNVLCIRRWGAMGAASGTLAAGILAVALVVSIGQRYYRIRWDYASLTAIFGLLFAGVILSVWLRDVGVPYPPRLAVKVLTALAYGWIGTHIGILSRENVGLARTALRRRLGVQPS